MKLQYTFLAVLSLSMLSYANPPDANPITFPSLFSIDPLAIREIMNTTCMSIPADTPEVGSFTDLSINAGGSITPIRIYTPEGVGPFPLALYIHGGGWVGGNLDTHDHLARYITAHANAVVVSVGYTNAPEGKFPLPLEQSYDALLWAQENASSLNITNQVALIGDSAGGNMAAAICLMARDREGPAISLQVLLNPVPDLTCKGTLEPQHDYIDVLRWFTMMYVNNPEEVYNPYVSPTLAEDFSNLPSALILLAELDKVRQSGEEYAQKLRAANVPTEIYCQLGVDHLASHAARATDIGIESLNVAVVALQKAFATDACE